MSADNIRHIGKVLHAEFELSSLAEFTLESKPKSVTRDKLYAAREIGVNRISFGIQSFIERFRSLFNLTSTREQINNTMAWSQEIIGTCRFRPTVWHAQPASRRTIIRFEASQRASS
ncbi:hypothetical protein [Bartonella sp. CL42QHWL]|uniref:hypothetical protein n=1 Tax=Bartonella sp. CL42QHWL TaxID=3243528 RepID=UPI0035CF803E